MNRILTRPMFRLGGSTNGIMTGLDKPKRGLVNEPGSYSVDDPFSPDNLLKTYGTAQEVTKKIYPQEETDLNPFLMNFGLDLLSRPPQGGLLSTVASSARAPTAQLFQDIKEQKASRRDLETGLFGTLVKARTDLASANKLGARQGNVVKATEQFNILDSAINDFNEKIIDEQKLSSITNRVAKTVGLYGVDISGDLIPYTNDKFIKGTIEDIEEDLITEDPTLNLPENKRKLREKMQEEFERRKTEATIKALTAVSVALKQQEDQEDQEDEALEEKAEGGRIGYQNAGPVMPSAMPSNMPAPGIMSKAPESMDQGSTEPGISYDELRARLPSEITDDIVRLISESPQALEDFATIQSQQDVNNFNTKYGVNLTLPPEA
jgi:hypothetical protein